jgi:formylglycine-generating enzyme required for sulfatase activity
MKKLVVLLLLGYLIGVTPNASGYDPECDLNHDGIIDQNDIFHIQQHWHETAPTPTPTPAATLTPTMTPTPEPEFTVELPGLPVNALPLVLILVPAGSFQMGSNDDETWSHCYPCEQPVHTVNIGYHFYMSRYEVTQAQWEVLIGSNPAQGFGVGNNYPVYSVSWDDCQSFITALNALGQGTFRLPSEAEWEYACRAGTTTRFSFGDSNCNPDDCTSCDLSSYAWWCGNDSPMGTKIVGQKLGNVWSLFDMHGNVHEWCQDQWHPDYTGAPSNGSAWETGGAATQRVIRGGSWRHMARHLRSSDRVYYDSPYSEDFIGLRIAGSP